MRVWCGETRAVCTLRSPWASWVPSSEVNFFAWKIDLRASGVGAQVPFDFWRHS